MQKRVAAAHGSYGIRYRVDKPYRKITLTWSELTGYSPATGKYDAQRELAQVSLANARRPPLGSPPATARIHLDLTKPGAYRLLLEGEGLTGEAASRDECIYWFDGKTFEEPQDLGENRKL